MSTRVCVIGAGVIGLSTACVIQQNIPNIQITIIAEKFHPDICSSGPSGFSQPVMVFSSTNTSITVQRKWLKTTFKHLKDLFYSKEGADAGISIYSGYGLLKEYETADPFWWDIMMGYRHMLPEELENYPGFKDGWFFTTMAADCTYYIPWLMRKFQNQGGVLQQRKVKDFKELANDYNIVINCAGLGANKLTNDTGVFPTRGQVIRVKAPWVKFFAIDQSSGDTYILPCRDTVLLGGTHTEDYNSDPSSTDSQGIISRCCQWIPSLKNAEIVEHWVGLRPSRKTGVRLETEIVMGSKLMYVVHNYGHGGSGVTLHWGCAHHACDLVKEAMRRLKSKM